MKKSLTTLSAVLVAFASRGTVLVYEGFHPADYNNVGSGSNVAAGDATFTAGHTTGIASGKWSKMNGTQIRVFGENYGLALPSAMTDAGFTAHGGSIGCNPASNNTDMRAMSHTLVTGTLKAVAGTTLYVRMLLNVDATAAGKLIAVGTPPVGTSGNYYGCGFTQSDGSNYRLLTNKKAAFAFAVWKNSDSQLVLSLALTTSSGTTATFYPLVTGATPGETYVCYTEIRVGSGTDGKEIVRAGAMAASAFTGAAPWAQIGDSTDSVEVDLVTDSSYPTVMAVGGPYGSNGGYFRADEIVVGTEMNDILPVGGVFAVSGSGVPTIGQNSFSTDWILVADAGVTADAGFVWSTDETFATATTNSLGTGLAAGTRTASLSALEPATTYWWKIYANNGTEVAETSAFSFTTTGAPVLGAVSATVNGNSAAFTVTLAEAALGNTLNTSVSVFYGTDGETWTELPLGSASAAETLSGSASNLDYGMTYQWFVRATATMQGGRVLATDSAIQSFTTLFPGDMYVNATSANPVVPYSTPATAALNIPEALALATDGSTIHVAQGLYRISTPLTLSNAVRILGDDPDPSRVVITNTVKANYKEGNHRVFYVNHADALVANLTMQKGSAWGDWAAGGNVYIASAGGTVSNCVIDAGIRVSGHDGGGGAALGAGLLTHCVICNSTSEAGSTQWGQNKAVALQLKGTSRAENCLIAHHHPTLALTLVTMGDTSVLRNCTIVDGSLTATSEWCTVRSPLVIGAKATVQNVVIAGVTNTVDNVPCLPTGTRANFLNGALEGDIEGLTFPENTITNTVTKFFRDYANGDYRPAPNGPLVSAGANYEGIAAVDLSGEQARLVGSRIDIGCYESPAACTLILLR